MPVRAVRLRVVLRTRAGEEVTDDRRIGVDLPPLDRKRVVVGLGHIEGLRQKAKSRGEEAGLATISIASVEFGDGSVWEAGGPTEGVPIEPLPLPRIPRK